MSNLAAKLLAKGLENASRIAFKHGGEAVRKAFSHAAGNSLRQGNGEVMKVLNEVGRILKKM